MKTCPKCRRYSDDASGTCDCGFSFSTGQTTPVIPDPRDRRGWVAVNLWAALLGFFALSIAALEVIARFWWAGLLVAAVAYAASEGLTRHLRYSGLGLRSPGLLQLGLVLAYTVVIGGLAVIAFIATVR